MDLTGLKVKPAEGMLLVKFVDSDEDIDEEIKYALESPTYEPKPYCGVLGIVLSVGPKCMYKPGQTVVMSEWARDGMKVGEGVLCYGGDVKANIEA